MKFKYYMRGFGAGLIIATIVLMAADKVQNNNNTLVSNNNENQSSGSVIAFTTENSTEGIEKTEAQTESLGSEDESTTTETTTVSETKAETKASQEASTQRPTVRITTGDGSGEIELVFSGVYTAAQAADILYDSGIIDNKTEFYTYMYTSGYDRKMRDGTYRLKPGDSYETIAKTITQTK